MIFADTRMAVLICAALLWSEKEILARLYLADIWCNKLLRGNGLICGGGERKRTVRRSRHRSTKSRRSAARAHHATQRRIIGKMRGRVACDSRCQPCST